MLRKLDINAGRVCMAHHVVERLLHNPEHRDCCTLLQLCLLGVYVDDQPKALTEVLADPLDSGHQPQFIKQRRTKIR